MTAAACNRRADDQAAVVCKDGRDGQTGDQRHLRIGRSEIRSGAFWTRLTCTGWRTSVTGVFPVSSGGDTESRLTTVMTAARLTVAKRNAGDMPEMRMARTFIRMRIRWIPGSPLHCGRSPHSAGRIRHRNWSISIRPMCW